MKFLIIMLKFSTYIFQILAGIIAVYYLIPKSNVVHEEILSRRSRSLEPEILIEEKIALEGNIKNSDEETSNQCFTGKSQ